MLSVSEEVQSWGGEGGDAIDGVGCRRVCDYALSCLAEVGCVGDPRRAECVDCSDCCGKMGGV